ncbi:hypothetical protein O7627_24180 [Solwaraspora sp. WMMD1047]|uniref:hypothetical protein n=1 Tax=Solwaraspora sp. WMMD1047 TaxID=3016102 RepID=UPI002417794E|nr:hypothetical protein [Solwaraspora sp. WMMD1047]MDG4832381.1 hypothetical protein [Solwaraspora sp. WMMD1047]
MTKRVTVSLPDDIAERLEGEPNASAYVAEAIRQRAARERGHQMLAEQGFVITEEGRARARQRLAEARERMTPERWAALRRVGQNPAA